MKFNPTVWSFFLFWTDGAWNNLLMGHPPKNFPSFCNILVGIKVDNTTLDLEIYIRVLQTCLLLEGRSGHRAGSELELIGVGLCVREHSGRWILGIQTHVIGATPLKKHHHQRKMNLTSNIIKSNANHALLCCLLRLMFSLCCPCHL